MVGLHGAEAFAATDKQERFVRLIEQGASNAEPCRIGGINRRTGTRKG